MSTRFILPIFLLAGCATAPHLWHMDSIDTGLSHFDATKITYMDPSSSMNIELIFTDDQWEGFFNLTSYQFRSSEKQLGKVLASFKIAGEKEDEYLPLLEGSMKVKISKKQVEKIIQALQEGKQIDIMVDSFVQTIKPDQFAKLLGQMKKKNDLKQFVHKFL